MIILQEAITAYSEIREHDGSPSTLGGRVQELPSGYAIERVLLTQAVEGRPVMALVQCLDPLGDGRAWGWVVADAIFYGA